MQIQKIEGIQDRSNNIYPPIVNEAEKVAVGNIGGSPKATFRKFAAENTLMTKAQFDQTLTDRFKSGMLQKEVLAKKIDPHTLIHEAILENSPEVIRFLLEHGVDVDYPDSFGMSPLTMAILNRCNYAVDVLLAAGANANPSVKWNDMTLFNIALNMNDSVTTQKLFDHGAIVAPEELGKIIEFIYIYPGQKDKWLELSKSIINRGIDLNYHKCPISPLRAAMFLALKGDRSILECMLQHGVDINAKDLSLNSPLLMAINGKKLELVKFLIEAGADINQKLSCAHLGIISPLKFAVDSNAPEIVQYLLQHGARA